MKKTLLALATTSALMVSGSALAAFVEATEGGAAGAGAKLEITGTITNTNPIWKWQIPGATQTAVENVELKMISGVEEATSTSWNITTDEKIILEGYMAAPSPKGGPGLTPVVSIGGVDMVKCTENSPCELEIEARDASNETATSVGTVAFRMMAAARAAIVELGTGNPRHGYWDGTLKARAHELLRKTKGYATLYEPQIQYHNWLVPGDTLASFDSLGATLSGVVYGKISQSRVYAMGPSKLLIPTDTPAPANWIATLPVTISVK